MTIILYCILCILNITSLRKFIKLYFNISNHFTNIKHLILKNSVHTYYFNILFQTYL